METTHYMMAAKLQDCGLPQPHPYTLFVDTSQPALEVQLRTGQGELAARGKIAVCGSHAVIDQVVTEEAHRRRGLGSKIMQALCTLAARRGARYGVLVATDDGRALYTGLGWSLCTPVASAVLPEAVA
jgi:GNAT superfamily N-acetyltransferase